jgi:hypothetical protein
MNGTIIDIPDINVSVTPIEMSDSSDVAYVIELKDKENTVEITILYGKIKEVRSSIKQ